MELLTVTLAFLCVSGMILAGWAVHSLRKHSEGESARMALLFQTALQHASAKNLSEVVDANARKEQHQLGLSHLRDAYEKELTEMRAKLAVAVPAGPTIVHDME